MRIKEQKQNLNEVLNLHSGAIHIENKLSLKARLCWFKMLYNSIPELNNKEIFTISIGELKKAINYRGTDNNNFKKLLEELKNTSIEWNIFEKNEPSWGWDHLLSGCRVRLNSNIIEYSFSPFLREKLSNPEVYAKINLFVSKNFKSKHSLSFYCLALDYLFIKNNYGEKNISLGEIRKYLGLKEIEYSKPGDLYIHVIKKAMNEINKNSDINLIIEPLRTERLKITGFKLKMSIKENFLEYYKPQKKLIDKPNQLNIFENTTSINQDKSIITVSNERLQEFFADNGISLTPKTIQEKLKELKDKLKSSFEDYLVFLMEYTKKENKKTKLKSISGFYIGLIKDDLQVSNYMVLSKKDIQKKEESKERLNRILEERLRNRYKSYSFEDFTNYLLMNQDNLEEKITELLNDNLRDKNQFVYDILTNQFGELDIRALTKSSVAIKSSVVGFLKNYKDELEYPETSFEYWRDKILEEEDVRKLREEIEKNTPM